MYDVKIGFGGAGLIETADFVGFGCRFAVGPFDARV